MESRPAAFYNICSGEATRLVRPHTHTHTPIKVNAKHEDDVQRFPRLLQQYNESTFLPSG